MGAYLSAAVFLSVRLIMHPALALLNKSDFG
jgi:hypothetical protein